MRTFLLLNLLLITIGNSYAQLSVQIPEDTIEPALFFADKLAGRGIHLNKFQLISNPGAVGIYQDSMKSSGFKSGIVISTGLAEQCVGPNGRPNAGANFGSLFFADEDLKSKYGLCDGVVLSAEFIPEFDSVSLQYVFASEEYPEFVNKEFNDLFAIYIKPKPVKNQKIVEMPENLAILNDGKPVSVHNVNSLINSQYFIANDIHSNKWFNEVEYDGFTVPLTAGMQVIPGKPYILKVILADGGDCEYDSGIFLELNGFTSLPRTRRGVNSKSGGTSTLAMVHSVPFPFNGEVLEPFELNQLIQLADSLRKNTYTKIFIAAYPSIVVDKKQNHALPLSRASYLKKLLIEYGVHSGHISIGIKKNVRPEDRTFQGAEIFFYR